MRRKLIISLLTTFAFVFATSKSCYAGDKNTNIKCSLAISLSNSQLSNSDDVVLTDPEPATSNSFSTHQLKSYKRCHPEPVALIKSSRSSSPVKPYSPGQKVIFSQIIFLLIFPFHAFW